MENLPSGFRVAVLLKRVLKCVERFYHQSIVRQAILDSVELEGLGRTVNVCLLRKVTVVRIIETVCDKT
jgi:hypothetical protein